MSEGDDQERVFDYKLFSNGTYRDVTRSKLRGKNWIHCPLCKRKLFSQKEIKAHLKNHRKSEQIKNRNEHHNDRDIEFPSINENCRGTGEKIWAEYNKDPDGVTFAFALLLDSN